MIFRGLLCTLGLVFISLLSAQETQTSPSTRTSGTFEVTLTPQGGNEPDSKLGRMSIVKQYHGGLEASGEGQMLTAYTATKGSAGYVAIERVRGTLNGRKGTFVLQHNGIMSRGEQHLMITVVPDSGTDELAGLTGTMTVTIVDKKHMYKFDYAFFPID